MKKIFVLCFLILLLTGCTLGQTTTYEIKDDPAVSLAMAKMSLNNFLSLLEQKQYSQAVLYFGGDYNVLRNLNLSIDKNNKAKLWESFCQNNGVCLNFQIIDEKAISENEFRFTVQYFNEDGSLFATSGCSCRGGGQDKFEFIVEKQGEQYLVKNLPTEKVK